MSADSTLHVETDKNYPFPVPFDAHRDKIRGGLLVTLELTEDLPRPVRLRARMNGTRSPWSRWRRRGDEVVLRIVVPGQAEAAEPGAGQ